MTQYFLRYGNYVHNYTEVTEFDSLKDAEDTAYEKAIEQCQETLYTHGFEPFSEEDADEMEEAYREEAENDYCEEQAIYLAEVYNPEKHDQEL